MAHRVLRTAVLVSVTWVASGAARAQVFTDVTATAGIGNPGDLTESLAWGDYDNDGDPDLYLAVDGPNKLYRNDGGGVFTDVTTQAGVGHTGFSVGCAFADLDNDNDLDLYIVSFGSGPDVLYRNDGPVGPGGAYQFTDVAAAAGITLEGSSRGMGYIDYNRDGLLDIYVNAIGPDLLYRNDGNLTFTNVASQFGIDLNSGQGVGVVASDIDNNGWVDLFTGNRSFDLNRLFFNNDGVLTDSTTSAGITETGLGMGVLAFDYDNDLDMDLYWTSWPTTANALYENITGTTFTNVAATSGTTDPLGWGISCNAGDVDNDGWEDFFVTNGFDASTTPNVLFRNNGDKTFTDVTAALGGGAFDGRGAAFADFDGDGDLDLCVTADLPDSNRLWRNDTVNSNHWLTLRLTGTCSNRSAVGARIEVTTDIRTTVKEVSGGAGRGSANDLPVEFGLGAATQVTQIVIRWPNGFMQTMGPVAMDQLLTVQEPAGCRPNVPATSEWGLFVIAVVLLTTGTIFVRRRVFA